MNPLRRSAAALAQYRRRAPWYDLELAAFEPMRREAIDALALQPGDTVIDAGCGTGLSFAPIEQRIGPRGRLVGFDPSPEMLEQARRRVGAMHWHNVRLDCTTAECASLPARGDAALFMFTHDMLRCAASVDAVIDHLHPGAHVAAAGLRWAPAWAWPANVLVWGAALYSTTTLEGLDAPWSLLAKRVPNLRVRPALMGMGYVAAGTV